MKIGLFSDTFHPVINGITFVLDITRAELESLGHEVYIFAPAPKVRFHEPDPHVIRFPAIRNVSYRDDLTSLFFPRPQMKRIAALELDIIHIFTPNQVGLLGIMAGLKHNVPVVCQYSTDIYEYVRYYPAALKIILAFPLAAPLVINGRFKNWSQAIRPLGQAHRVGAWRQRLTAEYITAINDKCDAIIALSRKHQQQLQAWGTTTPIHLIPTGVDPLPQASASAAAEFRTQHGIEPNARIILFVGRLSAEKNLELLIDAFAELNHQHTDVKLLLIGDFDYAPVLKAYAAATGCADSVIFTGFIERQKLSLAYQSASIFAFPSLTDTQGLVIHEAACAGLPIVMCDAQLSEIVVDGVNGLLAEPTAPDLARCLAKLLDNEALRRQMGTESRQLAATMSASAQAAKLQQLYRQLLTRQ